MNKFLRYSFVVLMAIILGKVSAQEVTFDFTLETEEGSKTSVWGFPAGSKNKVAEEKSFTYGGYTIKVAGSEGEGYYWHDKDHYLLFGKQGATLTLPKFDFDVERIDIEGTSGASTGIKQNIFVGDEAVSTETKGAQNVTNEFLIAEGKQSAGTIYIIKVTSNHNNQIKTIKVWKKGTISGQTSDEVKKVTVADFNAAAESNDVWYQLTGIVKNLKDGDIYGNFDLEDETGSVYVYGLLSEKGGDKKKFQELAAAKGIKNGCKLTIIGTRGSYNGKIEVMNAYFVSVEPGSITPDDPKDPETDKGTLEKPFTPAEANEFVAKLGDNESVNDYYIKGKIIEITDKNQFSTQYGNCTFYISDDGTDKADKFYVFRTLYLGNVKYTEGILPKAGDEVIICGKLVNYKGNTPETVQNKSYIYSLNGETTGIANTLIDDADAPLFNLAGQRVDASYKGVVIKNGKKMLQK